MGARACPTCCPERYGPTPSTPTQDGCSSPRAPLIGSICGFVRLPGWGRFTLRRLGGRDLSGRGRSPRFPLRGRGLPLALSVRFSLLVPLALSLLGFRTLALGLLLGLLLLLLFVPLGLLLVLALLLFGGITLHALVELDPGAS